jgi:dissimilatory sulfite reductase (desulfoviridin) alpha/beta subunit
MTSLSREELQSLKAQAMIVEKGGGQFTVRLSVTGGHVEAEHLRAVAAIADRFGNGCVHLTTRQGIEIPHVAFENLAPLRLALEKAGLRLAAAGKCVRGIVACPGSCCVHGLTDTQGLARKLQTWLGGRGGLPHKFKIAVAGCPNGCTKPVENDLGIQGRAGGFALFVGGKMGKHPRWADRLPLEVRDEAHLLKVIEAVINWYAAEGKERERFGATIERVGLDQLVQHVSGVQA